MGFHLEETILKQIVVCLVLVNNGGYVNSEESWLDNWGLNSISDDLFGK